LVTVAADASIDIWTPPEIRDRPARGETLEQR
jgi:hypothetical protein